MSEPTHILGIESSCDETSCAVVTDGCGVLGNVVASQVDLHAAFGGVVPELASRAHIEAIYPVIRGAMERANVPPERIAAVAVTHEPGLIGSLLVGLMAAKTLAWTWDVPLVGINHVYAHAYAARLNAEAIQYPAAALICSGGHTALYRCGGPTELTLLGSTLDDAAGEAFDKVAAILSLGYPGGPVIDKLARSGNAKAIDFPRSMLRDAALDFSFSGIKTAVLYHVNGPPNATGKPRRRKNRPASDVPTGLGADGYNDAQIADIAASFQAAVVDVLIAKLRRAAEQTRARSIILGGGVSANSALRSAAETLADELGCTLRMPELKYCLDNAAMIAALAYHNLRDGKTDGYDLQAHATVRR